MPGFALQCIANFIMLRTKIPKVAVCEHPPWIAIFANNAICVYIQYTQCTQIYISVLECIIRVTQNHCENELIYTELFLWLLDLGLYLSAWILCLFWIKLLMQKMYVFLLLWDEWNIFKIVFGTINTWTMKFISLIVELVFWVRFSAVYFVCKLRLRYICWDALYN